MSRREAERGDFLERARAGRVGPRGAGVSVRRADSGHALPADEAIREGMLPPGERRGRGVDRAVHVSRMRSVGAARRAGRVRRRGEGIRQAGAEGRRARCAPAARRPPRVRRRPGPSSADRGRGRLPFLRRGPPLRADPGPASRGSEDPRRALPALRRDRRLRSSASAPPPSDEPGRSSPAPRRRRRWTKPSAGSTASRSFSGTGVLGAGEGGARAPRARGGRFGRSGPPPS